MTSSEMLNDLDYMKTLAEEGRTAPAIGGRIGLWWGCLLCLTLFAHWAVLVGKLPVEQDMVGLLWMGFGILGGIGSIILGKTLKEKPGASSVNNRLSSTIWGASASLLFTFGVSLGFAGAFGIIDFKMMDLMMPIAFGFYAQTSFIESRFNNQNWRLVPALIALALVPVGIFLVGQPVLYLVSIAGVIVTLIIPDTIDLLAEPEAVI